MSHTLSDTKNSVGVGPSNVDEVTHNAVVVKWNPRNSPVRVSLLLKYYRNDPKFSDRYAWANSADPDHWSSLISVYTVCHSLCIVWTDYSMVEPHSSNFRVITTNFMGVRIFRKFTVSSLYLLSVLLYCNICFKVDKKAMVRNRYNRILFPALNTKRERDTYNQRLSCDSL